VISTPKFSALIKCSAFEGEYGHPKAKGLDDLI
jgi:hypothetical protein